MNVWYKDSDADFDMVEPSICKKLCMFYNSSKFLKMEKPAITINGLVYEFEFFSSSYNQRLKSRGRSYYYRQGESIIRISDHWSKSQYTKSKKLNCGFIASCYWTNLNGIKFTYQSQNLIGGICKLTDFRYKRFE